MNLGGVKPDGTMMNEMSYILLDVIRRNWFCLANWMVQLSKLNPDSFMDRSENLPNRIRTPSILDTDAVFRNTSDQQGHCDTRNGGAWLRGNRCIWH